MKDMLTLIKANEHGFTLLEIMVAVAVIAIAVTAVLSLHSQTLTMNIAKNFHTHAPLLARKIIAEWETEMAVKGSAFGLNNTLDDFPEYSYEISELEMEPELLFSETTGPNNARIVELSCTILYNDGEYHYTGKALKLINK
jgi:general secretion pathway protein I